MSRKKLMEEMSWTELKEALAEADTALIPAGSVEVEGPHLPMAVDSIAAMEVARRVAEVTEGTIVAPLFNVTYSAWHGAFAGTLSLTMPTLMQVMKETCRDLCRHGFKRLFFINSHIGNDASIWNTANDLAAEGLARVGMVSLWPLSTEIGQEMSELKENTFLHAGEIMTSVIMAIRPDLVDMSRAVTEYLKPKTDGYQAVLSSKAKVGGRVISIYHTSDELTQSGVMGDPSHASAEKGERIICKMVEYISQAVCEFRRVPLPPGIGR
ncbi:MAG: creatininase family protein [Desulfarculaceae bacterium]|nr:creatininase family protein [Desulfarculaceae bacterium]MCF8049170.1 creatininase family protein [Desulfarculaceae bacterium]MCF8065423.1 creatininase family protein [Desulfarculaceae bacterium]MCF8096704.1 creatininase family protein [Desulfarculaceae bacterium]